PPLRRSGEPNPISLSTIAPIVSRANVIKLMPAALADRKNMIDSCTARMRPFQLLIYKSAANATKPFPLLKNFGVNNFFHKRVRHKRPPLVPMRRHHIRIPNSPALVIGVHLVRIPAPPLTVVPKLFSLSALIRAVEGSNIFKLRYGITTFDTCSPPTFPALLLGPGSTFL